MVTAGTARSLCAVFGGPGESMRVGLARRYLDLTRVRLPYVMIIWAGFFVGEVIYFNTHRLGLFLGPLGFLRCAAIGGHLPRIDPPAWFALPFAALCLLAFMIEQSRPLPRPSERALLFRLGLAASTMWGVVAVWLYHEPQGRAVWNLMKMAPVAVAALLLAGLWSKWTRVRRFKVVAALVVCVAVDLLRDYLVDKWRLGAL